MSREQALLNIGLQDCDYALCTYHPVTMEGTVQNNLQESASDDAQNNTRTDLSVDVQIASFLDAVRSFPELTFIVTKSNADQGGARINALLDQAEADIPNLHVFTSLGVRRYLSLMKHAALVLGNSSSGIIETPALQVPTVNIGDRQRGRLQSANIINCGPESSQIVEAIKKARSDAHRTLCKTVLSPYGDGHAAPRIAAKAVETVRSGKIDLKKKFYDL